MISVSGEIVESAVAVRCVHRFGAGLESALAYFVVVYFGLVALFHEHDWRQPRAYILQQAAARTGQAWVFGLCQGKGDRTGGRLHPGLNIAVCAAILVSARRAA